MIEKPPMKPSNLSSVASAKEDQPPNNMRLPAFTQLASQVSYIIDAEPATDPSNSEILFAARNERLIALLVQRYGHIADFYYIVRNPVRLAQMEAALRIGAASFDARGGKSTRPLSGLCLVLKIIIKTIQSHFCHAVCPPPEPGGRAVLQRFGPIDASKDFNLFQSISKDFKPKIPPHHSITPFCPTNP